MHRGTKLTALLWRTAALAVALTTSAALAVPSTSPCGNWLTANGHGVIQITECGTALCGRIVGVDRTPSEPMPLDVYGHPLCGLTIITNERPETDGTWLGEITDPRDGGRYQAKLWIDQDGALRLRGFIGIPALGATQTWHKFTGHLASDCRMV
jgi:uncharacterized protein (DUF2147 family)